MKIGSSVWIHLILSLSLIGLAQAEELLPAGSFRSADYPGSVFRIEGKTLVRVSFTPTSTQQPSLILPTAEELLQLRVVTVRGFGTARRSAFANAQSQVHPEAIHVSQPDYRPWKKRTGWIATAPDTPENWEWICELSYTVRPHARPANPSREVPKEFMEAKAISPQ